jgi:hypothetical protein
MKTYARWLFGTAAAFNILLGLTLVFLRPMMQQRLGVEAADGVNLVLGNMAGLLAALLGVIYALIAGDPARYRPIIVLAAFGKLLAVVVVVAPWLRGEIAGALPVLVMGDLVYAALFLDYVRRSRA